MVKAPTDVRTSRNSVACINSYSLRIVASLGEHLGRIGDEPDPTHINAFIDLAGRTFQA